MESEIQKLREENETLRRDLQRRIRESDGELALQKQVYHPQDGRHNLRGDIHSCLYIWCVQKSRAIFT